MINVFEYWTYLNLIVNKNQTGESVSPDRFNDMIGGVVNSFVEGLYEPRKSAGAQQYSLLSVDQAQLVVDYLDALRVVDLPISLDAAGIGSKPTNYAHLLNAHVKQQVDDSEYKEVRKFENAGPTIQGVKGSVQPEVKNKRVAVDFLTAGQWEHRINNEVRKVDLDNVIAKFASGQIYVYPAGYPILYFSYQRLPAKPVLGYTVDANGVIQYNAAASTDIELPEMALDQLTYKFVTRLGIRWRSEFLIAEALKGGGA